MASIAQETREAGSRRDGLWLTLLLAAMVLLNYVDRGAVGIAAPKLKDELMLSAAAFGVVVSAFSWIYAPAQFAVGWLSDRFCVYRMIAAGLVGLAALLVIGAIRALAGHGMQLAQRPAGGFVLLGLLLAAACAMRNRATATHLDSR